MEGLTCLVSPPERMWCPDDNMADYSHILFNKTPSQLRLLGARGGKAYGRNQRARRARLTTSPAAIPVRVAQAREILEPYLSVQPQIAEIERTRALAVS